MKAKTHAVTIEGFGTRLVMAQTCKGAIRGRIAEIIDDLRDKARVDIATGEQIYQAGADGDGILGHDRFKKIVDPNQLPLAGIPETDNPPAETPE